VLLNISKRNFCMYILNTNNYKRSPDLHSIGPIIIIIFIKYMNIGNEIKSLRF